MKYNRRAFKDVIGGILTLVALLFVCFVIVVSHPTPGFRVGLRYPFWTSISIAPPATSGARRTLFDGKLDERFAVDWPRALQLGSVETVTVQIAANTYEELLENVDKATRNIRRESFRGAPKLVVTLVGDSGFEIVPKHSDEQIIAKGKRHKEWSWEVLPKATGQHQLTLRVYGEVANIHEDYDPETEQYEVAFNLRYWLSNGIQQNGLLWGWALFFLLLTNLVTWIATRKRTKESQR